GASQRIPLHRELEGAMGKQRLPALWRRRLPPAGGAHAEGLWAEQPSDLMLAIDLLWSGGMPWLGRSLAALFGMDSAAAGRTWRGAAVSAPKIISRVQ